jgi:hypothetical protein
MQVTAAAVICFVVEATVQVVLHKRSWQPCPQGWATGIFFQTVTGPGLATGYGGLADFGYEVWIPGTARAIRLATASGLANPFATGVRWHRNGYTPPPSHLPNPTINLETCSVSNSPCGWWC